MHIICWFGKKKQGNIDVLATVGTYGNKACNFHGYWLPRSGWVALTGG
jgi:hypothetical protein